MEKYFVVQRFIMIMHNSHVNTAYAIFVKSKWINSQQNIYATDFLLCDSLSGNFVKYSFIHIKHLLGILKVHCICFIISLWNVVYFNNPTWKM